MGTKRQPQEALIEFAIHLATLGVGILVLWLDRSDGVWDFLAELFVQ